ncbi:MAG: SEC-C metal-binding domain-containing protein, partial [SAR324 cluster bacterium]|nr:SEC-C metal-binding domain-containing protein [SAR324 cluster bacterium]
ESKQADLKSLMTETRGVEPSQEEVEGVFRDFERQILLSVNDSLWKDHLLSMDHLREGIGLVGYAQKKPIDEYKRGAFEMFTDLMMRISKDATATFFRAHFGVQAPERSERAERAERAERDLQFRHGEDSGDDAPQAGPLRMPVRKAAKLGRNDPCHGGSGKKYKNCHMLQERQRAAVN